MPSLPAEYVQNIAKPYHLFYRSWSYSDVGSPITGLWIRIDLMRTDPDPAFLQIAEPDPVLNPEFWWLKIEKNLQLKKIGYVFL